MSLTQVINYVTAGNFTFNASKIEFTGSVARLILEDLTAQTFNQSFASSTGFTFDSAKTEFVAGVMQQKDQTATNSLFGGSYDAATVDLNWHKSGGSLTGTLNGVPTISGGKLVCTGTQGVYYTRVTGTTETHKFIYTPNYTTAPPANINLVSVWNGTNNNDRFNLTHSPSGNTLRLTLYDSTGGVVIAVATAVGAAYTPTAATDYEFEVSIDSVTGIVRVFIDGVLHGSNSPGAWTRGTSSSRFYMGASPSVYNRAEASFDDYIMFSDIQHTAGYTPGYVVTDAIYGIDTVDLPNFTYSGIGVIQSLDLLATTEGGSPRYTLEGMYWNGATWTASDGSYAQANDKATINTNIAALSVTSPVSVQAVWAETNTQASVDDLTLTYTGVVGRF